MTKVIGPALSLEAKGKFGNTVQFQKTPEGFSLYKKHKPGDVVKKEPSNLQISKRYIYKFASIRWQVFTDEEKEVWNTLAKQQGDIMSGWNLYYKNVCKDQLNNLGIVALWDFTKGSSYDFSGNGLVATATLGDGHYESDGLHFDGITTRISPDVVNLNSLMKKSEGSVTCILKYNNIDNLNDLSSQYYIRLFVNPNDRIEIRKTGVSRKLLQIVEFDSLIYYNQVTLTEELKQTFSLTVTWSYEKNKIRAYIDNNKYFESDSMISKFEGNLNELYTWIGTDKVEMLFPYKDVMKAVIITNSYLSEDEIFKQNIFFKKNFKLGSLIL